ncbi:MAG TPA: TlpA disulfide reductase family protein [Woeseiaceae bacterium]|nr:TlpA disulfide reductase family protein [Woeseiaceae bacterium]
MKNTPAPGLQVSHWFNTEHPIVLTDLLGKVVLIEAFQMLCPGCVSHGLPQALRVADTFGRDDVVVLGLHTVFEHHEAQGTREALAAFLHEYRIHFPVGIDAPSAAGSLPRTMSAYGMQGTPTLILIDRNGRLRKQQFGSQQDLALGAEIMALIKET